jgi:signal transduction histidine kinase
MRNTLRSLWAEPRAPLPESQPWWDGVLVAVMVPVAILEGLLRPDLVWRPAALVVGVCVISTVLWRRSSSFGAMVAAFGVIHLVELAAILSGTQWEGLYSTAVVLLLPYSLFRWGAGRQAVAGLVIMIAVYGLAILRDYTGPGDLIGGAVVFTFPAVLGTSVRFWASSRARQLDQVKLLEREQLARELHDSVAHHVSAIAIQAQAGRVLAATRSGAAIEALEVIEEAASRTLTELRSMVGTLRNGEEAELAPQPGLIDIERLADSAGDKLPVEVTLSGDLGDLRPSIGSALYRLAQESVTNAVRHARHATRIAVFVTGDDDVVRLTVTDDGDPGPFGPGPPGGFGLVGMTERAALLGGTLTAGPDRTRGWTVEAVLPRHGGAR